MARRVRIDRLLVERGLFESRTQAQSAIAAGRVRANELVVARPSEEISADAVLRAEPAHPYVSRGGVKLAAALDHFRSDAMFNPRGRVCLDVGASTGGFTEVLLARGARRVHAVDVGREACETRGRARSARSRRRMRRDRWLRHVVRLACRRHRTVGNSGRRR